MERIVALLAPELAPRGRCLEVGVGTGRNAVPLAAAGVRMFGIDLSGAMLRKLLEKSTAVPVALADATAQPFPDDAFGAAMAVHVLHLIPDWRGAVREMARVVRPGGTLLIDVGSWDRDDTRDLEDRFEAETGVPQRFVGLGWGGAGDLDAELAAMGAEGPRLLSVEVEGRSRSVDELVQELEDGLYSWTWPIDEGVRHRAAAAVRTWAAGHYGSLDTLLPARRPITIRAYDLP
jgi:SAM-dependent methyltransferase